MKFFRSPFNWPEIISAYKKKLLDLNNKSFLLKYLLPHYENES